MVLGTHFEATGNHFFRHDVDRREFFSGEQLERVVLGPGVGGNLFRHWLLALSASDRAL